MKLDGFPAGRACPIVPLRAQFLSQASRPALSFAVGMAAFVGSAVLFSPAARAACTYSSPLPFAAFVQCGTTTTTDTTNATSPANDRYYSIPAPASGSLTIDAGAVVSGFGLAISTPPVLGSSVTVTNNGTISVDAGNTPTAGGNSAALSVEAFNTITYTGGGTIINNGVGHAFFANQIGAGATNITATGMITAANGSGIEVRDTAAGGNISITAGAVTASGEGIHAFSQSTTANVTIVANGDIRAGGAGLDGFIAPSAATGNIDITANGAIDAFYGIVGQTMGTGTVTVKAVGPITATNYGVLATGNGGDVSVTTGAVTSTGGTAIYASQAGAPLSTGTLNVTANGDVSGVAGIVATSTNRGAVTVTANGSITATTGEGVFASSLNGTSLTVTTGAVTSTGNTAIYARQDVGPVRVTANGNVSGTTGIDAGNSFGFVGVTANGTVTGTTGAGIYAHGPRSVDVQVAQTVTGATRGLWVSGGGPIAGNISVTGTGGFVGGSGEAAYIENNGPGTVTFNISGASSSTSGSGIVVRDTNVGGEIKVTTGAVTALGGAGAGIDVLSVSTAPGANLTIVANGDIRAGGIGISSQIVPTGASGDIDITANGSIDALVGIAAVNLGDGKVTVNAVGPITATGYGVYATSDGGPVSVTTGAVTSTGGPAIYVRQNNFLGNGIQVTANGDVSGTTGIDAVKNGLGFVGVTANGTVTGTSAEGIIVNGSLGVDVKVARTVTGATRGLSVIGGSAFGGDISVTGTGGFVGGSDDAAHIQSNGTNATVTVNISGASSSTSGNGIVVRDASLGGEIKVTTGAVTALAAGKNGIDVLSLSLAAGANVTIVANGDVQAGGVGIIGRNAFGATGNLDITANANVTGASGIEATSASAGSLNVTAIGTVTGTTGDGISANVTDNPGTGLSVSAAAVSGGRIGINAQNFGGGVTNVSASGQVTGTNWYGITASNNPFSFSSSGDLVGFSSQPVNPPTDVIVKASGGVTGGITGVLVGNGGTGELRVDTRGGAVSGGTRDGIVAMNNVNSVAGPSTNLSVTSDAVSGARHGIVAMNQGSGSNTVTAYGAVSGGTGYGIAAVNGTYTAFSVANAGTVTPGGAAGTDLTVTAYGPVSGGLAGIYADNQGSGVTRVTAGTVTGTAGEGIIATGNGAVDVQVAGTVSGATRGLSLVGGTGGAGNISVTGTGGFVGGSDDAANILNNGSGTVTVNISGASSSTSGNGIVVRDTVAGGNISVTTGAVTALAGGKIGIDVETLSATGNVTIVANGDVKAGSVGIFAGHPSGSGNVDVTANGAIDARSGIIAVTGGTGAVTVTAVGPITATTGRGIDAESSGGHVSVTAGAVSSAAGIAIFALQDNAAGAGTIHVATNGDVSGTIGIEAINLGPGAISVIANGAVTGTSAEGIIATGTGVVDVQIAGTVMGATRGLTLTGAMGTISVSAAGTVRNLSGLSTDAAIQASGGPIALANAGTIIGTVSFGAGADTFANSGTWRTAGGTSDFGGGGDTLRNTASGILDAAGAGGPATTVFNNLGLFVNQGRLTMANGLGGDVIQTSGNARFESGSVYAIDISGGVSDRFTVVGNAQLAGTLAVTVNGASGSVRYTVLTANGGVSGRFDAVTGGNNFLVLHDSYDANNAYLDVTKRAFISAALTPNQIAAAGGLDSLPASNTLANAIFNLATDAQARAAFDQLSGDAHASLSTALVEDSRFVRGSALDRLRSAFDAPGAASVPVMSYAPGGPSSIRVAPSEMFAIWGQGYGAWGRLGGDGNAARLNRSAGGFTTGIDTALFSTAALPVRVGLLAGYSNTNFYTANRSSSGTSDNYHMGAYAGAQWGAFGLRAGVVQTWHDIRTSRSVAFMGFTDVLRASYDARTTQVFGDLGYRITTGRFGFEPFANLAYVNLRTNGFREMGGAAALTSQGRTSSVTFSTLGLRASSQFDLGGVALTARGTLGWRHAFGAVTPQAVFAFAGGTPFAISGIAIARNAAVVEAGLDLQITPVATFGVSYSGQFASTANDQSLKGNLAVKF